MSTRFSYVNNPPAGIKELLKRNKTKDDSEIKYTTSKVESFEESILRRIKEHFDNMKEDTSDVSELDKELAELDRKMQSIKVNSPISSEISNESDILDIGDPPKLIRQNAYCVEQPTQDIQDTQDIKIETGSIKLTPEIKKKVKKPVANAIQRGHKFMTLKESSKKSKPLSEKEKNATKRWR